MVVMPSSEVDDLGVGTPATGVGPDFLKLFDQESLR